MKSPCLLAAIAFFSVFVILPERAQSQSQRLGLPVGNFTIDGKGRVARRGYCMDAGVPAPKPGANLQNLLTDTNQVEVVIGQRSPMRLPEAIQQGFLRLEAQGQFHGKTVAEVADDKSVNAGLRVYLKALESDVFWPGLYSAIRSKLATDVRPQFDSYIREKNVPEDDAKNLLAVADSLSGGDGERVAFVNLTSESMEIRIKSPAIFSERQQGVNDILPVIPSANSDAEHTAFQQRIWLDNSALHASLSGKTVDAYLESADRRDGLVTFTRSGTEVFVLGRKDGGFELRIVDGGLIKDVVQGSGVLPTFSGRLNQQVIDASKGKTQFMRVDYFSDRGADVHIQLGLRNIKMNAEGFARFIAGDAPPAELSDAFHNTAIGTPIVVWRDPLTRVSDGVQQQYHTFLVRRLQETFGDRIDVYLDDDMDASLQRIASISLIATPEDLALLSDKKSFPYSDFKVVENIENDLVSHRVAVYRDVTIERLKTGLSVKSPSIVVLTGHKDKPFREYYQALVDSGVLKDKVVVMCSCYQGGDEALNSAAMRSLNAPKAVFFYSEEIHPSAVEDVLRSIAAELDKDGRDPADLREILERSIERALADPETLESQKPHIERLRNGVMQVSDVKRCILGYYVHSLS